MVIDFRNYLVSYVDDVKIYILKWLIKRILVKDTQQPILILGGKHVVMKQGADMLDEPIVFYATDSVIRGVAIHVASAQLFVSTSMGYVYRTSITEQSAPKAILSPGGINFKPLSLSVDWLNLHLYVLGEVKHATTVWQIARCNLDGKSLTVAMAGFLTRPSHIEVDPYNGYLFWVTKAGLFRLDLADISNGVKHEVPMIFICNYILSFTFSSYIKKPENFCFFKIN